MYININIIYYKKKVINCNCIYYIFSCIMPSYDCNKFFLTTILRKKFILFKVKFNIFNIIMYFF